MRSLGGQEWVFRSRENTPITPGTLGVYDPPEIEDFRQPLESVANQLLRDVTNLVSTGN